MTCQSAEKSILKLLEGELALAEREVLDTHLHSCAVCNRSWEEHRRLAQMVGRWAYRDCALEVSTAAFTSNLLDKITDRPNSIPTTLRMPLLFAALSIAVPLISCHGLLTDIHSLSDLACVVPDWISANLLSSSTLLPGNWQSEAFKVHLPPWSVSLLLGMCLVNTLFYSRALQSRKGSWI